VPAIDILEVTQPIIIDIILTPKYMLGYTNNTYAFSESKARREGRPKTNVCGINYLPEPQNKKTPFFSSLFE